MTERLFVVKDELWFEVNRTTGETAGQTHPTIRPYRRRSWTEASLRAAFDYIKGQPDPKKFRLIGSNTLEVAEKLGFSR